VNRSFEVQRQGAGCANVTDGALTGCCAVLDGRRRRRTSASSLVLWLAPPEIGRLDTTDGLWVWLGCCAEARAGARERAYC
jgi:hypothetical protein